MGQAGGVPHREGLLSSPVTRCKAMAASARQTRRVRCARRRTRRERVAGSRPAAGGRFGHQARARRFAWRAVARNARAFASGLACCHRRRSGVAAQRLPLALEFARPHLTRLEGKVNDKPCSIPFHSIPFHSFPFNSFPSALFHADPPASTCICPYLPASIRIHRQPPPSPTGDPANADDASSASDAERLSRRTAARQHRLRQGTRRRPARLHARQPATHRPPVASGARATEAAAGVLRRLAGKRPVPDAARLLHWHGHRALHTATRRVVQTRRTGAGAAGRRAGEDRSLLSDVDHLHFPPQRRSQRFLPAARAYPRHPVRGRFDRQPGRRRRSHPASLRFVTGAARAVAGFARARLRRRSDGERSRSAAPSRPARRRADRA